MDYFYMINKWFRNDLKKLQKEELIETLKNDIINGPIYALHLYKMIDDLPIEFEDKIFNIISLGSKASYNYFENEKDKLVKKLTPERRILLLKSINQDLYILGNFVKYYATIKEITMIIKNLQSQNFYVQNNKKSYNHLITSIWEKCISITDFPFKRLLIKNEKIIFKFLMDYYRNFTLDEIKNIYDQHHKLILEQCQRNYEKLYNYCELFNNFITFEKDLLINLIIKQDNKIINFHYQLNIFNFNQTQMDKLEAVIIMKKIIGE